MNKIDYIIEKIQKLLSLANSSNENEAKAAAAKANALLVKYNIEMQQVKDKNFEYGSMEATEAPQIKWHQHYIIDLIQDYFFVKVTIRTAWDDRQRRRRRTIQLVGTKENCRIASYVFAYLNDIYPRLWWAYKDAPERRHMGLRRHQRNSYFVGLTEGISAILKQTKFRVEEEMGLVLYEDPDLKKYVEDMTKGKKCADSSQKEFDMEIFKQGFEDGKNVQLRKPIESDQNEGEVLFLTQGE